MKFLIKNANVVFKENVKKKDIFIENGVIKKIEDNIIKSSTKTINASNLFCMPGIVDIHVHLRDPGYTEKETIKTGAKAAAAGGVTSIACMANTNPVIDSVSNLKILQNKICNENIHIYPIAAITKGLKGKELVDFKAFAEAKVYGFSDDGFCVTNNHLMQTAMKEAFKLNLPILSHCEDINMLNKGIVNEGIVSSTLNVKGINNASESIMVARDAYLSFLTGLPVHICHVSTRESVEIIRMAKKNGVKITAQTCPHYFMLTDKEVLKKDANFKMNPPLRSEKDRIAIEQAILDGTIDIIATDHAPHEYAAKQNFETAANGVIGLETSLACTLTNFYITKKVNMPFIAKIMCEKPAEILNIKNTGAIYKGAVADLIILDINRKWVVEKENFLSKSKNSAFIGKTLQGKVLYTFCSGNLVFKYNNYWTGGIKIG